MLVPVTLNLGKRKCRSVPRERIRVPSHVPQQPAEAVECLNFKHTHAPWRASSNALAQTGLQNVALEHYERTDVARDVERPLEAVEHLGMVTLPLVDGPEISEYPALIVPVADLAPKNAARNGRRTEAWVRMGLKLAKHVIDEQFQCALHSYGQVRQFFLDRPCSSLERELILITDEHGNTFLVRTHLLEGAAQVVAQLPPP